MFILFHSLLKKKLAKTDPVNETDDVRVLEEIVAESEMRNDRTLSKRRERTIRTFKR